MMTTDYLLAKNVIHQSHQCHNHWWH